MKDLSTEPGFWTNPTPQTLQTAVLLTLAYADVFDYPLTEQEVHRYLVGMRTSRSRVQDSLERCRASEYVAQSGDYFTLAGREQLGEVRRERAWVAADVWPRAIAFGKAMAHLPFVRMVAVTGALSMDNAIEDDDIDYLIVAEVGRLWLCRAMVIQFVVRPAARRGTELCPNYLLTERAFTAFSHNLFTAHEIVQMVPIAGAAMYRQICEQNRWVDRFLPNAYGLPRSTEVEVATGDGRVITSAVERGLRSGMGGWLERWEMTRKIRRFERQQRGDAEASFSEDWCKGHFESHGRLVREALLVRLASLVSGLDRPSTARV